MRLYRALLLKRIGGVLAFYVKPRSVRIQTIPNLAVEVTSRCDSNCIFCANALMKRPRQDLDREIFRKVVEEYVALGGTEITFNCVIGEPLLDPFLLERLRFVRSFPGIKALGFVSNLQWLHRLRLEDLFEIGSIWVCVSTILSGRQRYKEMFGVDRYDQMLENLIRLLEMRARYPEKRVFVKFSLKCRKDESYEEIIAHPDFRRIQALSGEPLLEGARLASQYYDDWGGRVRLPHFLKRRPLYPRWLRPCRLLYGGVVLFSDGMYGLCQCRDLEQDNELLLGDAREVSLAQIWGGSTHRELIRQWQRANKIPVPCRACRHYFYY